MDDEIEEEIDGEDEEEVVEYESPASAAKAIEGRRRALKSNIAVATAERNSADTNVYRELCNDVIADLTTQLRELG